MLTAPSTTAVGTTTAPEGLLINHIQAHIRKGDQAKERATQNIKKSEDHYIAAGRYLTMLKATYAPTWQQWETILKVKVRLSTGRASELMQIADGRKTVEQVRTDTAKRVIKHARKASSLESKTNEENQATVEADRKEVTGLYQQVCKAEAERDAFRNKTQSPNTKIDAPRAEIALRTGGDLRSQSEGSHNRNPDYQRFHDVQARHRAQAVIIDILDERIRKLVIETVLQGERQSAFDDFRNAIADLYQQLSRAGR